MNSNHIGKGRRLFRLSIALFAVSLALPIGDGWWGWQAFAASFWVLPQAATSDRDLFFIALSGVLTNLCLFFTWVSASVTRLRRFAPWSAVGAILFAIASLCSMPMLALGLGFWVWFSSSAIICPAARQIAKSTREPQPSAPDNAMPAHPV